MGQETELKLLIDKDRVPALRRHPLLAGLPFRRVALRNWYFDTLDLALSRARMGLRLRKAGRRWVQTLKTASQAESGLARRGEWEAGHSTPIIDLSLLADTPLARFKGARRLHERLQIVFSTDFVRQSWEVNYQEALIEVALDQGSIRAEDRSLMLCEVELELREGPEASLFGMARELGAEIPLHLSQVSKAERGYRLYRGEPDATVRARAIALQKASPPQVALASMLQGCLGQVLPNRDRVLASDDVEALHQLRIALRRLRSALRLAREDTFNEDLRWLGQALSAARDWGVFHSSLWPQWRSAWGGQQPEAEIRKVELAMDAARRNAWDVARAALDSPRAANLFLGLQAHAEWLPNHPESALALSFKNAADWADHALHLQYRRCHKRWCKLDVAGREELHALRIQVKRLRYALDFFESILPRHMVREWQAPLSALQGSLGKIQDAVSALRLLQTLEPSVPESLRIFAEGYGAAVQDAGLAKAKELSGGLDRLGKLR